LVIIRVFLGVLGGYELTLTTWNVKPVGEIKIAFRSADPGAKDAEIIFLTNALSAEQQTTAPNK
jgi:hypothetical protein